jgi:hypothetical protein
MLSNAFSSFFCDAEKLYTQQWSRIDGVGALIITPTRELAYQVTCLKVGNRVSDPHWFSADPDPAFVSNCRSRPGSSSGFTVLMTENWKTFAAEQKTLLFFYIKNCNFLLPRAKAFIKEKPSKENIQHFKT